MKKFLYSLIATIVAINFLCTPALAEEKTTPVYVTCQIGLNIRTIPTVYDNEPYDTVPYGTELKKLRDSAREGWTLIRYDDKLKYVYSAYLTENIQDITPEEPAPASNITLWGTCTITHYCNCSACCGQWAGGATASGAPPVPNHTVACGALPFGTRIMINGQEYVVEDRGVNGYWIDIYCSSHSEANARGMYSAEVYIIN